MQRIRLPNRSLSGLDHPPVGEEDADEAVPAAETGYGGIPIVDLWVISSEYGGARSTPSGLSK